MTTDDPKRITWEAAFDLNRMADYLRNPIFINQDVIEPPGAIQKMC